MNLIHMRWIATLFVLAFISLLVAGCTTTSETNNQGFSKDAMDTNSKGLDLYMKGNYNDALAAFNQSIALDPSFTRAWNNKGLTLIKMERYAEAAECFTRTLELDPAYPGTKENLDAVLAKTK